MADPSKYSNWLPDEVYQKAVGQARLQFSGIFEPFTCYGLDVYIPGAVAECMTVLEQFGKRVRGRDVPIVRRRDDEQRSQTETD